MYYQYVESELRVVVKNPPPQSEWGFQTCSKGVFAEIQYISYTKAVVRYGNKVEFLG